MSVDELASTKDDESPTSEVRPSATREEVPKKRQKVHHRTSKLIIESDVEEEERQDMISPSEPSPIPRSDGTAPVSVSAGGPGS